MLKYILGFAIVLASLCTPMAARATCGTLPYTFLNNPGGSVVDANTTNANNQFLLSCASSIDNTQIGPNGIFANQIIPTTVAQATFGGSQAYTFPLGVTLAGNLTITNGVVVAPSGTPLQLCSGTTLCLSVATNGLVTAPSLQVNGTTTITGSANVTGVSSFLGGGSFGASGAPLLLGTAASAAAPVLANDGSGGLLVYVPSGAANGIRFVSYNGTSGTQLAKIDPSGSFSATTNVTGAYVSSTGAVNATTLLTHAASQVYPYDGSGVGGATEHIERGFGTLNGSGVYSFTFATAYTNVPICNSTYRVASVLPVSTAPVGANSSTTTVTVYGNATTGIQWECIGS